LISIKIWRFQFNQFVNLIISWKYLKFKCFKGLHTLMNKVKSNKTFNSMSKIYLLVEFRKKKFFWNNDRNTKKNMRCLTICSMFLSTFNIWFVINFVEVILLWFMCFWINNAFELQRRNRAFSATNFYLNMTSFVTHVIAIYKRK